MAPASRLSRENSVGAPLWCAALTTLLPRTAATPAGHVWCCFRPTTADEQPVIDRVAGLENAWVTCGHFRTGILMAVGTGDAPAGSGPANAPSAWRRSGSGGSPAEAAPWPESR
jgi:glycine/D-amino acid oxidase-like deaminating enzyme